MPAIFDPTAESFAVDRERVYQHLRDEHPVYHDAERDTWVLSRFADVLQAATAAETFSSGASEADVLLPMLNYLDAPRHGQLRRLLSRAFTPKRVADMERMVRLEVDRLLDRYTEQGGGDLIANFSGPLAACVVGKLIGIPDDQIDDFRELTDRLLLVGQQGSTDELAQVAAGIYGMFHDLLKLRRDRPENDMMTALVQVQAEGGITDEEVLGFCFLLVGGGNDTTSNLIANGWVLLLDHPNQFELITSDPLILPNAIEEMLRLRPPAESHARTTTMAVELHGAVIPQGARVQLLWGAANLDDREFPRAEKFDVLRSPTRHLTFGQGPHFCMGAALGRLEAKVAFEGLISRAAQSRLSARPQRLRSPWAYAFEDVRLELPAM